VIMAILRLRDRWRAHFGPAPLNEFKDYDEYWEKRGALEIVFRRWVFAAEHMTQGASVLDVGSGSGDFVRYLRQFRPDVDLTASDLSAVAMQSASRAGVKAVRLDISREDILGQFDYVTAFEVLEHIPNAEDALRRMLEAAREQVLISIPNVGYIISRLRLGLFGRFPITNIQFHMAEHVRHWSPKDFKEWIEYLGYRVVHMEGQYGSKYLPWKRYPQLFSPGMIYVVERQPRQLAETPSN
jgi:2-polyprenyl-3-methyl-5-hydroxy-6-metoxy-1,4-benzoquinol methylase